MATIKDVAKAAGVSTASVSRVLTGHPASPTMRERVLAAAEALSFRPNAVARSLRSTGTRTVGLVVSDLLNPFFTELARAVEDTARAAGYSVIVGNADEDPGQQDHYIRILLERQVDGLIVVPTVETSPLLREAAANDHHLVLVDRPADDVDAPTILADATEAIGELVDHLVTTGRRDPAIITGPVHAGTARLRLEVFRQALAKHGLDLPERRVLHGDFRSTSGYAAMEHLLADPDRPDAVFVTNGSMGLGVLEVLGRRRGTPPAIPDELALAVFDDTPWFTLLAPSVTAIAQPTVHLGEQATRTLLARIRGEEPPAATPGLRCRLVLRESTNPRRKP
ncbi:LacI family transcriptional regulator [Georgenia sp. TF02-10]|uniref:LacI family DNA-binding transcriptional regulator n=1 Tax=Georgenia sp. TF02-10 TaxID=2917725 RepID=UPI001FA7A2C6|nr:LacI family DNA-binding transcriptional regulator [Georgenia sp. TF02-10]UNX54227.1 LacI family transcriptional regulator [Georgenia sp. TF02-10]